MSINGENVLVFFCCFCANCMLFAFSARKSMETRSQQDEERANILEVQVDEAKVIAEDADRKYEEVYKCFTVISLFFLLIYI